MRTTHKIRTFIFSINIFALLFSFLFISDAHAASQVISSNTTTYGCYALSPNYGAEFHAGENASISRMVFEFDKTGTLSLSGLSVTIYNRIIATPPIGNAIGTLNAVSTSSSDPNDGSSYQDVTFTGLVPVVAGDDYFYEISYTTTEPNLCMNTTMVGNNNWSDVYGSGSTAYVNVYSNNVNQVGATWNALIYVLYPQTISYTASIPSPAYVGKNFIDTATSTAGGSVTLSIDTSTTSACSASSYAGGYLISFLNTGNCVVDANEGSIGNYLAATQTQETFTISPAPINLTISYTGTGFQFGHTGTLQIVVTLSGSDGLVTFYNNNKKLFRCTTIQSISYVATCNWKPDIHGLGKLTAYAIPSNGSYTPNTSAPMSLMISARTVSHG